MYTASDLYDIVSQYYGIPRNSFTDLTPTEWGYVYNDVQILSELYALRCLLYTISANMIYEGRF